MHVTVVTVTYGDRWRLLQRTLAAAFDAGADRAVVIDNASGAEIAEKVSLTFPGKALTIRLPANLGSAGGYCAGIRTAIADGAEYIILLDDDNCLEIGALERLKQAYSSISDGSSRDRLSVVAFRPEQMPGILEGFPHDPLGESGDTFFGFHVRDIPRKLLSRIRKRFRESKEIHHLPIRGPVRLRTAPFGGMLFHRALVERFGYPDSRYALYVDDTEFSFRITANGGEVWLVQAARIIDIDTSWQVSERGKTSFEVWLDNGSALRAYYTARNWSYFQTHCRKHSWVLRVNRHCYVAALWFIAVFRGKLRRYRVLIAAIRAGEQGLLGINPQYPLGA